MIENSCAGGRTASEFGLGPKSIEGGGRKSRYSIFSKQFFMRGEPYQWHVTNRFIIPDVKTCSKD